MRARVLLVLALIFALSWPCAAQAPESRTWRRTVFGLEFSFQYPARFEQKIEAANPLTYRETLLLPGETPPTWRESIDVQAFEYFRKTASLYTPERMLLDVEKVFQKTCAGHVAVLPLPADGLGVKWSSASVFRCTPKDPAEPVEAILHLAMLGKGGIYMIVWGELSTRSSEAALPEIDATLWGARLRSLAPVSLCEAGSMRACF